MGGHDKGLVMLDGKPLVEHVIHKLEQQVPSVTINANRNHDSYSRYAKVFSDHRTGFQGPLAGIEMSLQSAASDWVGFVPCDSPNLPGDLVSRLTESLDDETDVYVAVVNNKVQPVFSVWNKKVLPTLTRYLENGDRKIMLLFEQINTRHIDFSDQPDCFINLNNPEDLSKLGHNNDN
ncbi:molybdenum cofactor guanylyltransferase MobA [Vibrio sp. JC009]|nr:molybdenum cofactor guanylyltransferase MobA [Vibrio sp. JC009]